MHLIGGGPFTSGKLSQDNPRTGNQAFDFIGLSSFSGDAGELRIRITDSGKTLIEGNTDDDLQPDFMIVLQETVTLSAGDFVL